MLNLADTLVCLDHAGSLAYVHLTLSAASKSVFAKDLLVRVLSAGRAEPAGDSGAKLEPTGDIR